MCIVVVYCIAQEGKKLTAWITVKIKTQNVNPFKKSKFGLYGEREGKKYPYHTGAYDVVRFKDETEAIRLFWELQTILENHREK